MGRAWSRNGDRGRRSMRRKFGLGDVEVSLCHGHGEKDTSEGRVNNGGGNLFDERMEAMKMKYR